MITELAALTKLAVVFNPINLTSCIPTETEFLQKPNIELIKYQFMFTHITSNNTATSK